MNNLLLSGVPTGPRCSSLDLKHRWFDHCRFDQADAEDADSILSRCQQGEARGQRFRRDQTGLEEDFVAFRQDNQPEVHVAGDAGIAEVESVTAGEV